MRSALFSAALYGLAAMGIVTTAHAQQPARILVGFAAGGSTDSLARYLAERMRAPLGRTVIVDNRPGAAGRIAVDATKASPPDGSAFMLVPSGPMTLFPHIFTDLKYDPARDFTPVAQAGIQDMCLAVGPAITARTVAEFRDWARANPGRASYATAGTGTIHHFTGVLFAQMSGLDMVQVPYKSGVAAATDVAAGQVPSAFFDCTSGLQFHKSGRLRFLASTGSARSEFHPDVPTMRESGLDIEVGAWFALYAPAGLPRATVDAVGRAVIEAVRSAEGREQMMKLGIQPTGLSADELAQVQRREFEMWGRIVRSSGFKPDR